MLQETSLVLAGSAMRQKRAVRSGGIGDEELKERIRSHDRELEGALKSVSGRSKGHEPVQRYHQHRRQSRHTSGSLNVSQETMLPPNMRDSFVEGGGLRGSMNDIFNNLNRTVTAVRKELLPGKGHGSGSSSSGEESDEESIAQEARRVSDASVTLQQRGRQQSRSDSMGQEPLEQYPKDDGDDVYREHRHDSAQGQDQEQNIREARVQRRTLRGLKRPRVAEVTPLPPTAHEDPTLFLPPWQYIVQLDASKGLGLRLGVTGNKVCVEGFAPLESGGDGPAYTCRAIAIGDVLLAIRGTDLTLMQKHADIVTALRGLLRCREGNLTMRFRRSEESQPPDPPELNRRSSYSSDADSFEGATALQGKSGRGVEGQAKATDLDFRAAGPLSPQSRAIAEATSTAIGSSSATTAGDKDAGASIEEAAEVCGRASHGPSCNRHQVMHMGMDLPHGLVQARLREIAKDLAAVHSRREKGYHSRYFEGRGRSILLAPASVSPPQRAGAGVDAARANLSTTANGSSILSSHGLSMKDTKDTKDRGDSGRIEVDIAECKAAAEKEVLKEDQLLEGEVSRIVSETADGHEAVTTPQHQYSYSGDETPLVPAVYTIQPIEAMEKELVNLLNQLGAGSLPLVPKEGTTEALTILSECHRCTSALRKVEWRSSEPWPPVELTSTLGVYLSETMRWSEELGSVLEVWSHCFTPLPPDSKAGLELRRQATDGFSGTGARRAEHQKLTAAILTAMFQAHTSWNHIEKVSQQVKFICRWFPLSTPGDEVDRGDGAVTRDEGERQTDGWEQWDEAQVLDFLARYGSYLNLEDACASLCARELPSATAALLSLASSSSTFQAKSSELATLLGLPHARVADPDAWAAKVLRTLQPRSRKLSTLQPRSKGSSQPLPLCLTLTHLGALFKSDASLAAVVCVAHFPHIRPGAVWEALSIESDRDATPEDHPKLAQSASLHAYLWTLLLSEECSECRLDKRLVHRAAGLSIKIAKELSSEEPDSAKHAICARASKGLREMLGLEDESASPSNIYSSVVDFMVQHWCLAPDTFSLDIKWLLKVASRTRSCLVPVCQRLCFAWKGPGESQNPFLPYDLSDEEDEKTGAEVVWNYLKAACVTSFIEGDHEMLVCGLKGVDTLDKRCRRAGPSNVGEAPTRLVGLVAHMAGLSSVQTSCEELGSACLESLGPVEATAVIREVPALLQSLPTLFFTSKLAKAHAAALKQKETAQTLLSELGAAAWAVEGKTPHDSTTHSLGLGLQWLAEAELGRDGGDALKLAHRVERAASDGQGRARGGGWGLKAGV
ncbi:unnamed protein product [Chrysoparadoxa australica]